jgi:hypothetical protein
MQTITLGRLAMILRDIKGATPVSISALCPANCNKTAVREGIKVRIPFETVLKLSRVNGFTGADYERSVNRQRDREGSVPVFEAQERSWGERISPALVEKENKLYLVVQIQRTLNKPIYFAKDGSGLLKQIQKDSIAAFLRKSSGAPRQGLDKEVIYRNYSLANITAISLGGEQYRIRG